MISFLAGLSVIWPDIRQCRSVLHRCFVILTLSCTPLASWAIDSVVLTVQAGGEGLQAKLEAASLVVAAKAAETENTQDILAAARADYGRMLGVLYAEAFYSGVISIRIDGREAFDIEPFSPPSRISEIVIDVETGPRFSFRTAEVRPLAENTQLPENFRVGGPANSPVIAAAATASVRGWRDIGHAKATLVDQYILADHRQAVLDARLDLEPGPRLTFGTMVVKNSGAVREERVRAIAGFPTGEVFSPADLETVARRLRRTGTFNVVGLAEVEAVGPGNTQDVELTLVDRPPRKFAIGGEIATTEGASLSGYWMHRNLFGGAENLRFDAAIKNVGGNVARTGGVDFLLGARLTRPASWGPDTAFSIFAKVEVEDEPVYRKQSAEIGVGAWRIFTDRFEATLGLGLRYSEFDDDLGDRSFLNFILPTTAIWDLRDDQLSPGQGFFLNAQVLPFVGLDATVSGARLFADGRYYLGFGADRNTVLAGRLQIGSIVGSSLRDTPPDYLFLSGGGGTVRGQSYQSLALTLPGGGEIGGRSFLGASVELRGMVTKTIGLVGFYDYGYIGPASYPDGNGDWHSGAGLGLRYDTGIGPLRFDIAVPVHGTSTAGNFALYVGIGQAF